MQLNVSGYALYVYMSYYPMSNQCSYSIVYHSKVS